MTEERRKQARRLIACTTSSPRSDLAGYVKLLTEALDEIDRLENTVVAELERSLRYEIRRSRQESTIRVRRIAELTKALKELV